MLPYTTYHIPEMKNHQTGQHGQWLWMIVPDLISDADQELLPKISAALKADYSTEVFFIKQVKGENFSLTAIADFNPKLVISFGSAPDQIGLWIDMAKPGMCILERFTFILTLTPEALSSNAAAKKELWRHMQSYLEWQAS
jgi:hypothetical protein